MRKKESETENGRERGSVGLDAKGPRGRGGTSAAAFGARMDEVTVRAAAVELCFFNIWMGELLLAGVILLTRSAKCMRWVSTYRLQTRKSYVHSLGTHLVMSTADVARKISCSSPPPPE